MKTLLLLASLLLVSCATPLSQPQPFPLNHEAKVMAHMELKLIDSESARYKFISAPTVQSAGSGPRFINRVLINSKNRLGGYVGFSPYYVLYRDGDVEMVYPNPFGMFK